MTKIDAIVMVEARRLAKEAIKNQIRANGGRVSHYTAQDISRRALDLLHEKPEIIETARSTIEIRGSTQASPPTNSTILEMPKRMRKPRPGSTRDIGTTIPQIQGAWDRYLKHRDHEQLGAECALIATACLVPLLTPST